MARAKDLWIAAGSLLALAGLSSLHWAPVESHTLVTGALLLACGSAFAREGSPRFVAPRPWLARAGPAALGITLAAGSAVLLAGPMDLPPRISSPTLQGLLLVTLIPLGEELYFRGALLRCAPRHPWLAAAATTVIFAAMHHAMGPFMMVTMAIVGAALAALVLVTRSVALGVVLHASFNGLAAAWQERDWCYLLLPVAVAVVLSALGWLPGRDRR
jgi:membrane protease YdiL (CAAX protease family)